MKIYIFCFELLILTTSVSILLLKAQECDEPLLETVINNDPRLKGIVVAYSGAPEASLALGLPLIGSTDAWELRYGGNESEFISPLFMLHDTAPGTPHFWITGIGIQNGFAPGSACGSSVLNENSFITKLKVSTGYGMNVTNYESIHAPYTSERDTGGDPVINLMQLGLNNRGRLLRLNFPPMGADQVKLQVFEVLPAPHSNVTNSVCLRVEFYGCRRGHPNPQEPNINKGPLLQYIVPYPDAQIDGYLHTDSAYTGVQSMGLLSGGVGLLTDGDLGETPLLSPEDYFGWSVCGIANPYIIFLFNGNYSVVDLIAKLWDKDSSGLEVKYNAFKAYDQFGNELRFDGEKVFNVSFLRIEFSFPMESMLLLLSEVSIASASKENVITGSNLTQLLAQKYNNTNDTNGMSNITNVSTVSVSTNYTHIINRTMNVTGMSTDPTKTGEANTLPYSIAVGVLSFIVVILLIIILVLILVLMSCYNSNVRNSSSETSNYHANQSNSNGNKQTDESTIECMKSSDTRVASDDLELSESQVYL